MQTSMPSLEIKSRDQKKYILHNYQGQTTVDLVTAKNVGLAGRGLFSFTFSPGTVRERPPIVQGQN